MKDPDKQLQLITAQTLDEALKVESGSIGAINVLHKDTAVYLLTMMISEVVLFLNVGKNMNAAQIKMTIDLILGDTELKNLKPVDFKVVCDGIKKGKYGKLYDRFDGQCFLELLYSYSAEKLAIIENNSITMAKHDKEKDTKPINPEIAKLLSSAIKDIPAEKKEPIEFKENVERDPRVTAAFKEFDKLHKENGKTFAKVRFVEYDGKFLNETEFVELKLSESAN